MQQELLQPLLAKVLSDFRIYSIRFLLREFRQLLLNIKPRLLSFNNAFDGTTDRILIRSYLLGAVPIAQREGVVIDRLKVDRNPKRRTKFVVP